MSILVVRLNPHTAKNVPQRNRSGHRFLHEPTVAELTPEQEAIVRSDGYLKVCNFPSVAWFDAMGIERTQVNEDKFKGKDGEFIAPTKVPEGARMAIKTGSDEGKAPTAPKNGAGQADANSEGGDANKGGNAAPDANAAPAGGNGDETVKTQGLFGKTVELSASSPKEELIKALERKRKVAGKDFNADATPEALFTLLKTL